MQEVRKLAPPNSHVLDSNDLKNKRFDATKRLKRCESAMMHDPQLRFPFDALPLHPLRKAGAQRFDSGTDGRGRWARGLFDTEGESEAIAHYAPPSMNAMHRSAVFNLSSARSTSTTCA